MEAGQMKCEAKRCRRRACYRATEIQGDGAFAAYVCATCCKRLLKAGLIQDPVSIRTGRRVK